MEKFIAHKFNNTDSIEYGVKKQGNDYTFTCAFDVKESLVLFITDMNDEFIISTPMTKYKYCGRVYSLTISDLECDKFKYYYMLDGEYVPDPYTNRKAYKKAYGVTYAEAYGEEKYKAVTGLCSYDEFDFEDDARPCINQSDVIAYQLHVRGFTKHSSSKVKGKGCFLGITEKISYLKELNINQIHLMPAYDFYEFDCPKEYTTKHPAYESDVTLDEAGNVIKNLPKEKINYWGYKAGNYFCPKYEYSYSDDAVSEFKEMVKSLHKAGIEVIMQMFYSSDIKPSIITDSLRYWYTEYHVDGFHIMGERIPIELILNDDVIYDAKLYFNNINKDDDITASLYKNRNVIDINDGFMISMRRFLKSDSDSLSGFIYANRLNSPVYKTVNYLTKYEGFTLNDLVSYEHKHNEANGENNNDGSENNFSWNCGIEGKSTKKAVKDLRIRQVKNALCLLLLSQGTPMLRMGDEILNSQDGNNNPYCQDSEITWLNWKLNKSSEEILSFTKRLISYRVINKAIHQDEELKNMDYLQTGTPDISYHQDMAWKSDFNNYMLHLGIMLDGAYGHRNNSRRIENVPSDTLYIAYNMHWENHVFGLPRLKASERWECVFATCTSEETEGIIKELSSSQEELNVYKRSVVVLKATKTALKEEK